MYRKLSEEWGMSEDAGQRLRRAIEEGIGRSTDVRSISALCRVAHLNRNTIYAWFTGKAVPSSQALSRVAHALDMSLMDLVAAWEGRYPEPTEEAIRDLTDRLDMLSRQLAVIIKKLELSSSVGLQVAIMDAIQSGGDNEPPNKSAGG